MLDQAARARPIRFGWVGHQLFAMLHTPPGTAVARPAVVLCPPFGQEAIRAHRTFKVFAERLARAGHTVLRLDYFGSGDADGDDSDLTLSSMASDIALADAHVREISGAQDTIWIGLRLGAAAACQAIELSSRKPQQVLLWDPIIDGKRYLEQLRKFHAVTLQEAFSLKPRKIPVAKNVVEAVGFGISPTLERELRALTSDKLNLPRQNVRVTLCASQDDTELASFTQQFRGAGQQSIDLRHDIAWLVESLDNGALVPAKAVQVLVGLAGATA